MTGKDYEVYKKWDLEEDIGYYKLQWIDKSNNGYISISFRIIEWVGETSEEDNLIGVISEGDIIWEGIRHIYFSPKDDGYINYPRVLSLSLCLKRLHEIALQYCPDWGYEEDMF